MNRGIFGFPLGEGALPVPEGIERVIVRGPAGQKAAARSDDSSIQILADASGEVLVRAGVFREVTGDPYTLVNTSRNLTAEDWSLIGDGTAITERSLYVLNSNPATATVITAVDDEEVTKAGKSVVIRVAPTQTGAVTVACGAGGTINGGTTPIQIVAGGIGVLTVLTNTNDNPAMSIAGDIVAARTLDGNLMAGSSVAGVAYHIGNFGLVMTTLEKTASFTWALTDRDDIVRANHATVAIVGTIPPNSSVAFATGTFLWLEQTGAAAASFAAGVGVTVNKPSDRTLVARARHSRLAAQKVDTDTWIVFGDMGT